MARLAHGVKSSVRLGKESKSLEEARLGDDVSSEVLERARFLGDLERSPRRLLHDGEVTEPVIPLLGELGLEVRKDTVHVDQYTCHDPAPSLHSGKTTERLGVSIRYSLTQMLSQSPVS